MKKMFIVSMMLLPTLAFADEKFEYALKVMGADYGTATLYFDNNRSYGDIKANEKWASVFNVQNKIASEVDTSGFPKKTQFTYRFNESHGMYDIDYGVNRVRIRKERNGAKSVRTLTTGKGNQMHDIISWLAEVRRAVSKSPEKPMTFKVFSGARVYNVHCQPQPVELLNTPLGAKTSKPYFVTVTRGKVYKREMRIWFNTTKNFEPLRLVGKFKMGLGEANIISLKSNEVGEEKK